MRWDNSGTQNVGGVHVFGGQKSEGPRKGTEEYQQLTRLFVQGSHIGNYRGQLRCSWASVCVERACRGEISLMNDY